MPITMLFAVLKSRLTWALGAVVMCTIGAASLWLWLNNHDDKVKQQVMLEQSNRSLETSMAIEAEKGQANVDAVVNHASAVTGIQAKVDTVLVQKETEVDNIMTDDTLTDLEKTNAVSRAQIAAVWAVYCKDKEVPECAH